MTFNKSGASVLRILSEEEKNSFIELRDEMYGGYMFSSTKTYPFNIGLSSAFRQWAADSHCKYLHGYSLGVKLKFKAIRLDRRNWVVDFGSLKPLKQILENTFDHKTLVAFDDPELDWFQEAYRRGICDLIIVPATGCEMFAAMIADVTKQWLVDAGYADRVKLVKCEVSEHIANSAIAEPRGD